jgi:hypothetical protein
MVNYFPKQFVLLVFQRTLTSFHFGAAPLRAMTSQLVYETEVNQIQLQPLHHTTLHTFCNLCIAPSSTNNLNNCIWYFVAWVLEKYISFLCKHGIMNFPDYLPCVTLRLHFSICIPPLQVWDQNAFWSKSHLNGSRFANVKRRFTKTDIDGHSKGKVVPVLN